MSTNVESNDSSGNDPVLGTVVVNLMKGVVYRDQNPDVWQQLEELYARVIDYLAVMGLDLIVDEAEGYAFLKQLNDEERDVPKLVARRPLSFPISLLCVLLRKKMVEQDAGGGEARLILTREQIVEMMRVFLPDRANEARLFDQIDTYINKVTEFGFLKKLNTNPPAWEVRRIIKALVDADWLADFNEKLKVYQDHAESIA
ncbi:hypothetical protein GZ77_02220 [Endozoicomonas montiporae]|uniref:DUF4194 domain-containing protein n=2 Tax=Endozoicomonas montiporae TaxID=1027273 RepID=A0A081NAK4_9GAMM|nr:DUF4194 domain-containing protein [Endozoicomonas montiporae]AMO56847.1 hypothetical protein EZMO1_2797 [Endozoicomonas montiporae CL-33]KEQ15477.1 hypothetical protein GZ77_02220 [Endozoicomonas montiporae]